MVSRLTRQVVSEEQSTNWVLDASAHFHHVLHDLFDGTLVYRHVDSTHSDHEVQAGNNISGILNKLVEVRKVVDGMVLLEVNREVSQRIKNGHVQFVILFRSETRGSQFGNKGRSVVVNPQYGYWLAHMFIASGDPTPLPRVNKASGRTAYPHFSASINLPGVSRHLRIMADCCRTTPNASSRRRVWSSWTGGGLAIVEGVRGS